MNAKTNTHIALGCRLNAYETAAMQEISQEEGLKDAVIVNTCAVTAEAVRKSRQAIRRARRENPSAKIVATGCAVQTDPSSFEGMTEIDVLLGNDRKLNSGIWRDIAVHKNERSLISDMDLAHPSNRLITGFGSRSRAHIQVQNGCDHRCTFCVIPFGRGRSRSIEADEVVRQVRLLVENGFNEIVLSGVDITDWGNGLPGRPRLGELAAAILKSVPELARLRMTSLDPVEIDRTFLEVLASEKRFMPHLHLSVQAGDNMILKRMKRRHQREDVIEFCAKARSLRPDIVFGADLIAGFPTESDEMAQNTLNLIAECGLTWLHIFPYSQRPGTPAARMPQVARKTIRERAVALRRIAERQTRSFLQGQVGRCRKVLMESPTTGRTEQFAMAKFETRQRTGTIIDCEFIGQDGSHLIAKAKAATG